MTKLTSEQKKAIATLQDTHGALIVLLQTIKASSKELPPWVEARCKEAIEAAQEACKVTTPLIEVKECDSDSSDRLPAPMLYDRPQAAALLNISLRSLDDQIAKRTLPVVRIGRAVRFRPEALKAYVEAIESKMNARRRRHQ